MVRKLVIILLSCLLVSGLFLPAYAMTDRGELQILIQPEGECVPNGEITLYRVGIPSGENYLLDADLCGGIIKGEDIHSSALASWLSELMDQKGISRILDADGNATFSRLPEGLYLIEHTQNDQTLPEAKPMLVSVPYAGCWNIGVLPAERTVIPESPQTGEHHSPLIGAMFIVLLVFFLGMSIDRFKGK